MGSLTNAASISLPTGLSLSGIALPIWLIPLIVYVVLAAFVVYSLFNLFHLLRFGLIAHISVTVGLVYIAATLLLVIQILLVVHGHDWAGSASVQTIQGVK